MPIMKEQLAPAGGWQCDAPPRAELWGSLAEALRIVGETHACHLDDIQVIPGPSSTKQIGTIRTMKSPHEPVESVIREQTAFGLLETNSSLKSQGGRAPPQRTGPLHPEHPTDLKLPKDRNRACRGDFFRSGPHPSAPDCHRAGPTMHEIGNCRP